MRILFSIVLALVGLTVLAQQKAVAPGEGGAPGPASKIVLRSEYKGADTAGVIYIVDGVVRNYNFLLTLDPKMIESITILKDKDAYSSSSCRANKGTIHIRLKCSQAIVPAL